MTNVSRSKGNQTVKFGQLIEYDMRNIFLEKPYPKCREPSNRAFSQKSKLSISLDQYSKLSCSLFYCMPNWGLSKYIETKLQTTCFLPNIRLFKKAKRGLELVFLPHSLHSFWGKIFLLLYSINCSSFIAWLPLLRDILSNMCIATVS